MSYDEQHDDGEHPHPDPAGRGPPVHPEGHPGEADHHGAGDEEAGEGVAGGAHELDLHGQAGVVAWWWWWKMGVEKSCELTECFYSPVET